MDVKALRIKSGLSQQELANKTGIPKDRIGKWEQGKGHPKGKDTLILNKFFEDNVPHETHALELNEPEVFGFLLSEMDVPREKAKKILGHKDIRSTDIYYHVTDEQVDREISKLNVL